MLKKLALTVTGATLMTTFVDVNSVQGMNLIRNGSFESSSLNPGRGFISLGTGSTAINNWTTTGPIDYIGGLWQASDGGRSLDLNSSSTGGISQTFDTIVGQNYTVTFDLAAHPDRRGSINKSMRVSAAGDSEVFTFNRTGKSTLNMGWETNTWMFSATGSSTTLSFISNIGGPYGPTLDNVSVTTVPEPLTILGAGMAVAFGTGLKKTLSKINKKSDL